MIRLLLVDDENNSREGLLKHIPWTELGIGEIIDAKNGLDALAKIQDMAPDILLTDVRMPKMDGIELATRIRNSSPDCIIIFISGFSDKEYLKSAISLNALGYVEKPIVEAELINLIIKAVEEKIQNTDNKILSELGKQKKLENHSLLRRELAISLALADYDPVKRDQLLGSQAASAMTGSAFTSMAVSAFSIKQDQGNAVLECLQHTMEDVVNRHMDPAIWYSTGQISANSYVIHINVDLNDLARWQNDLNLLYRQLAEIAGNISVSIGIGDCVDNIHRLPHSYMTACKALDEQFFWKENGISFFTRIREPEALSSEFAADLVAQFHVLLNEGKEKKIVNLLDSTAESFISFIRADIPAIKDFYIKMYADLVYYAEEQNMKPDSNDDLYYWEYIAHAKNIFSILDFFKNSLQRYFSLIGEKNAAETLVYKARKYIEANYSDHSLSSKTIAQQTHVSLGYLCTIFKRQTGKTISEYITETRITKAKELLADKNIKLNNISEQVGFDNANYFGKVFKKTTGTSTTEFRER